jgi:ribose transport system permease protein
VSGVVLAVVQGQGKADLASGYELDIIASAVVGGAAWSAARLGGRRGSRGADLRRAPQCAATIPGATFYDRCIVGAVVIVIVVMDSLLTTRAS